LHSKFDKSGRI
jgi:hypothetical protein